MTDNDDLPNVDLEVPADPQCTVTDGAPFLILKEEPSEIIRVPAEDRTIRVPRRP